MRRELLAARLLIIMLATCADNLNVINESTVNITAKGPF